MAKWRRKYPRRARFNGSCSICDEPFEKGTEIAWSPGRSADHWSCYIDGHKERRDPAYHPGPRENVIGIPVRPGLSSRAQRDMELLRRLHPEPPT